MLERHRANPGVRELPCAHGSAGFQPRELRRARPVAHDGRRVRRSTRPACCWTAPRSTGPAALRRALVAQKEQFVRTVTGKLLTYALGREMEYYDAPAIRCDRARGGRRRLPLVVDDSGDRQERAVSDEEVAVMIVTKKAISRRTVLRGIGHGRRAAAARRHGAGADGRCRTRRRKPCAAWASSTTRTASSTRTGCRRASAASSSSRPCSQPLEPFRDQLVVVTGLVEPSGGSARRRRRRSLARVRDRI